MDLKQLTRQHNKSVAVVFKKMGFNSPVTPAHVTLAAALYKDDFANAVAEQVLNDESLSSWDGQLFIPGGGNLGDIIKAKKEGKPFNAVKTLPNVTVTARKKSDKVRNTLLDIVSVIGAGYGAYKTAKATPGNVYTPTSTGSGEAVYQEPEKKKPNYVLIAGIIIIITLIVLVLAKKNK